MRKFIFNLQFPHWCPELRIDGIAFRRHSDYVHRVRTLQHLNSCFTDDVQTDVCSGRNAVTAFADLPDTISRSVLPWDVSDVSALDDVLLLLTFLCGRNVFAVDHDMDDETVVLADPRQHLWGMVLRLAALYSPKRDPSTDRVYDAGLERYAEQALATMRSREWQHTYNSGEYLFLVRSLLETRTLEAGFVQAWTIWEHLFSVINRSWLSDRSRREMAVAEKIAFILVHFGIRPTLDEKKHGRIRDLAHVRNRLVHYGRLPERDHVRDDAVLFVRLTEYVVARTLGLSPTDNAVAFADLEKFFEDQPRQRFELRRLA